LVGDGVIVGVNVGAGVKVNVAVGGTVGTSVSVGIATALLQEVSKTRNTSAEKAKSDFIEFFWGVMIISPP